MNIFGLFEKRVADALGRVAEAGKIPSGLDVSRVVVEPPRDPSHGDLATNAAMVLAKEARMNPRALAELLVADLQDDPRVTKVEIAGPGFINIRLAPAVLHEVLRAVVVTRLAPGDGLLRGFGDINGNERDDGRGADAGDQCLERIAARQIGVVRVVVRLWPSRSVVTLVAIAVLAVATWLVTAIATQAVAFRFAYAALPLWFLGLGGLVLLRGGRAIAVLVLVAELCVSGWFLLSVSDLSPLLTRFTPEGRP